MRRILVPALAALCVLACGRAEDSGGDADLGLAPVTPEETYDRMQVAAARKDWAELCSHVHPDYLARVETYCRQLSKRPQSLGGGKELAKKCAALSGVPLIVEVANHSPQARGLFSSFAKPGGKTVTKAGDADGVPEGLVTVRFPDDTRRLYYFVMIDGEWKWAP